MLRRRDFVALLGGAGLFLAAKRRARAQQAAMPVVGFLHPGSLAMNRYNVAAFNQGLAEAHTSRAGTWRSNSAGRIINWVSCRRSRPISSACGPR